jgi:histidinol-phosphate aminotransferase
MIEKKNHLLSLRRIRANSFLEKDEEALYLDRNERSTPYPNSVMQEIAEIVTKCPLQRYPDVIELYESLANWLKIKPTELFITEGVSGAIKSILETVTTKGDNVISPTPSFALYPVYADMFELENRHFGYTKDYKFDMESLYSQVDEKTAVVFVPNPNVPIEGGLELREIEVLCVHCKETNTLLVIDEVYFPFGGPTAKELVKKHENLLIMRSFSKAAGLAGIRVGYVIGSEKNIDYISKMRTGYETNRLSIEVVKYFIKNEYLISNYVEEVKESFKILKQLLDRKGIEYTGAEWSNFIYINLLSTQKASNTVKELQKRKIYVRGGWEAPFDTGFSVTGAPLEQFKILLKALDEIL